MSEKSCITINCGCCGGGSGNKEDGAPVGTVISYMGTKAPEHYLVCDGAIINIADYAYLAEQIKDEFGAVDYFGGDGTSTFAVPDLRNEFLRGYRGDSAEQLSEEIGMHQDPTEVPYMWGGGSNVGFHKSTFPSNMDNYVPYSGEYLMASGNEGTDGSGTLMYSTRPTNVTVLYCIKYE